MQNSNKRKDNMLNLFLELLKLVKPLTGYMCLAVSAGVIGFLMAIFIPIFGTYAMADILGFKVPLSFNVLIILCFTFAALRGFLRYGEQLCNHFIAFTVLAILRDKIFFALRRLAPAKLENRDKGSLISMVTADVEIMEVFYAHTVSPMIIGGIVSVVMVLFIGSFHWIFGIIAVLTYLFVGVFLPLYISKVGRKSGIMQRESFSKLNDYMYETLKGISEIFQFGVEKQRVDIITKIGSDLKNNQRKLKKYGFQTSLLNGFAMVFFPALILIFGGKLYQTGQIDFPSIIIPVIALLSSFGPVLALSNVANTLLLVSASGKRIIDLINEQPEVNEITNGSDIIFNKLECDNISFSYQKENILNGLSLNLEQNKILSINGKSGSGKSTLLKLMMRFWETDSGAIKISGENINHINTSSLRINQSYLTQNPILLDDTIAENIRIGNHNADMEDIKNAAKKASVDEFISKLENGYDTRVGELGDRLSTGEKQRISLARLFLHDAPLLLLDEPTSNIDSLNEGIILKSLKDASADKTIILVTHRTSTKGIAEEYLNMSEIRKS